MGGLENPRFIVGKPLHPQRVTAWCGLWSGGVIGPYFFENEAGATVTSRNHNDAWIRLISEAFLLECIYGLQFIGIILLYPIQEMLADKTVDYIKQKYSVKAKAYKVDVTDYQQLMNLKAQVSHDLGDVTILINNAGILTISSFDNPPPEDIRKMIDVNITAIVYVTQVFLPRMKDLNHGYIVNVSSVAALISCPFVLIYGATKAAVRFLTSAQRVDLRRQGYQITATSLMPTFINTNDKVCELISAMNVDRLLPRTHGDLVAGYMIRGMLNGDDEVAVPRVFLYMLKTIELLPVYIKETIYILVIKSNLMTLDMEHINSILKRPKANKSVLDSNLS